MHDDSMIDAGDDERPRSPMGIRAWAIRTALMHFVMAAMVAVTFFGIVPRFEKVFKDFDVELPGLTQIALDLTSLCRAYWFILLAGWIGWTFAIVSLFESGSRTFARLFNAATVVGFLFFALLFGLAMFLPLAAIRLYLR